MSIMLEHTSLIIPIANIERSKLPGGFAKLQELIARTTNCTCWHDGLLLRDGAVTPRQVRDMMRRWEECGLTAIERIGGQPGFKDLCLVDRFGGLLLPCDWLELDLKAGVAWMKGAAKGLTAGPAGGADRELMAVNRHWERMAALCP